MAEKILIASGKGGVGKTSLCVGIGRALSTMGKRVLIIDCDSLGSVDIYTGITRKLVYNWGDVIKGSCDVSEAVYRAGDVAVLACPGDYSGVTTEKMKELVSFFDDGFDCILLDSPAGTGWGFRLAAAVADRAIVVSTPDTVCVRSVAAAAGALREMGMADVRLVVNRVNRKEIVKGMLLNIDSVIDSVQVQLIGIVPEDPKLRMGAMGEGIYRPKQDCFVPITNIARRICGEEVPLKL